jgi:hypothetical protein
VLERTVHLQRLVSLGDGARRERHVAMAPVETMSLASSSRGQWRPARTRGPRTNVDGPDDLESLSSSRPLLVSDEGLAIHGRVERFSDQHIYPHERASPPGPARERRCTESRTDLYRQRLSELRRSGRASGSRLPPITTRPPCRSAEQRRTDECGPMPPRSDDVIVLVGLIHEYELAV